MSHNSFAPGKIILSGEYAVVFGYAGIALPASIGMEVVFEEDPSYEHIEIIWEGMHGDDPWLLYAKNIIGFCQKMRPTPCGRLFVRSGLPLGKGMGASSSLLIAIARSLLGDDREAALLIEDGLNPGHSGLDFTTIWESAPVLFQKGTAAKRIELPPGLLRGAVLIDTGLPSESTTELVAWMRSRETEIQDALKIIGSCTERILQGGALDLVMRDHHRAQVALGVVPKAVQELVAAIELSGGAAKVIGAGSRTGGAGMVLALGDHAAIQNSVNGRSMSIINV